jgi:cell division septal protein FtsQ
VIGGVLIAAAVITLYSPWLGIIDLREIVVEGNRHLAKEEIIRASGLRLGCSLLRTPVRHALEEICELAWVKEISIRRVYPHTVEILVCERAPIALISDPESEGRLLIVGEGGVIVQRTSEAASSILLIRGGYLTSTDPGGRLTDPGVVVALERLHHRGLNAVVFRLADFSDPRAVVLYTEEGLEVALGPVDGIEERIDALAALLATLNLVDYRSIDLRFGGEAILVPRKVVKR